MTTLFPKTHCLPMLILAKSPLNTHSDCAIVYNNEEKLTIVASISHFSI